MRVKRASDPQANPNGGRGTAERLFWAIVLSTAFVHVGIAALGVCAVMFTMRWPYPWARSSSLMSHLPMLPTVFLAAAALTGVGLAVRSLMIELRTMAAFRKAVADSARPLPPVLAAAASRAGFAGRVDVVSAHARFAATYGLLAPRVVVSTALLESVTEGELDAVLAHESVHLTGYDPLRMLVLSALPSRAHDLPAVRQLRSRFIARRELAADRNALERCGRRSLAGALLKVVDGPPWATAAPLARIGTSETFQVRLAQIETGAEPPLPKITSRAKYQSLLGAAGVALAYAWSLPLLFACCARHGFFL